MLTKSCIPTEITQCKGKHLPSQSVQNTKNVSAITLRSRKQYQGPQPVASFSSANELAQLHSTPKKDDDKNLKSKLPNNFYVGESSTSNSDLQQ